MTLELGLISLDFDDLDALYAAAAVRGFRRVELYVGKDVDESDLDRILAERERGIAVSSVSSLAKLALAEDDLPEHVALVERSILLAAAVGAPFATFMYGSCATLPRPAARDRFLARLMPLVELADEHGVTLLIENVFSRGAEGDLDSVAVTRDLFERLDTPRVGLNLDPANYAIAGDPDSPRAFVELAPFTRSLHLKDARPLRPEDEPLGARRALVDHRRGPFVVVPLGQGIVEVDALLADLARDGRELLVSLEPTASGAASEAWLDASCAYLAERGVAAAAAAIRGIEKEGVR